MALPVALAVSLHYGCSLLWPAVLACSALFVVPGYALAILALGTLGWAAYLVLDGAEFREGRPDPAYSRDAWLLRTMRAYLRLQLHRAEQVEIKLLEQAQKDAAPQAIYATFPHGVNSDFRACLDAMLSDAFPRTAPTRTLAATVLFRIPAVRRLCLATGCVDAGRPTAKRVLRKGLSLMVLPGGLDEQLETIYGRERIVLKSRYGFVKLAIEHGIPLVPTYVFGCSDLYYTSRFLHGLRKTIAKFARVALPIYWGRWGFCAYPWPKGFPLEVPQHVVFGDPVFVQQRESPTRAEVEAEHARFVQALTKLFDENKAEFGAAGRTLEIM